MNLMQLSVDWGIPLRTLKERLEKDYHAIVLSDQIELSKNLMEKLNDLHDKEKQAVRTAQLQQPARNPEEFREKINYTKKLIRYCIDHHFLFMIDTCSMVGNYKAFASFYRLFCAAPKPKNMKLIVPFAVHQEMLRILTEGKKDPEILKNCEKSLALIDAEWKAGRIDIVGSEEDKRRDQYGRLVYHADRLFLEKLTYFRNNNKSVLLITQDHDMTLNALEINNQLCTWSNGIILAKKIMCGGALGDNADDAKCPVLPL